MAKYYKYMKIQSVIFSGCTPLYVSLCWTTAFSTWVSSWYGRTSFKETVEDPTGKNVLETRQQPLNDHDVTCEFLRLEVFRLWIDWLVVACLQVLCSVYPAVWLKVLLFYFFAHVHILTWYFHSFPLYSWCLIYLMKQIIGCDPGGRQDVLRLWVVF